MNTKVAAQSAIAAVSPSADKTTGAMKIYNRTRIAYMAGTLITGKPIFSLYDCDNLTHIEIDSLPDAGCLREFGHKYKNYAGVNGRKFKYRCACDDNKYTIDLSIKGNTFIGYITGSSAVFMGNVRGDSIYIYDREDSLHLNYRISGEL